MPKIRDEQLMAHIDGELPGIEDSRVAEALHEDEALRAQADAQRRLKERLARRYDPIASEPVPDRFRTMLETNVVRFPAPRSAPEIARRWPQVAAIAASFVVGILAAQMIPSDDPNALGGSALIASGDLANALDSQLASSQDPRSPTRVGLSFAARDGRLCRTFETSATAGLACRSGESWQLIASAPGSRAAGGEYRQAGSGPALVMETAEALMAGAPFDAQAERRAMDKGWTVRP